MLFSRSPMASIVIIDDTTVVSPSPASEILIIYARPIRDVAFSLLFRPRLWICDLRPFNPSKRFMFVIYGYIFFNIHSVRIIIWCVTRICPLYTRRHCSTYIENFGACQIVRVAYYSYEQVSHILIILKCLFVLHNTLY